MSAIELNPRLYLQEPTTETASVIGRLYAYVPVWPDPVSLNPRLYLDGGSTATDSVIARLYADGSSYVMPLGGTVWKYFRGVGLSLVFARGPQYGADDNSNDAMSGSKNCTVTVYRATLSGGTISVSSDSYELELNLYYDRPWSYKDGIDPRYGINPAVVPIAEELPWGFSWYYLEITNTGSLPLALDDVWVFSQNINVPVLTFSTDSNIGQLSAETHLDFQRNEVTVVGQRKGF